MKIECTKEEWEMLETLINQTTNTSTGYNWPNFECQFYFTEDCLMKIEGTFTN